MDQLNAANEGDNQARRAMKAEQKQATGADPTEDETKDADDDDSENQQPIRFFGDDDGYGTEQAVTKDTAQPVQDSVRRVNFEQFLGLRLRRKPLSSGGEGGEARMKSERAASHRRVSWTVPSPSSATVAPATVAPL